MSDERQVCPTPTNIGNGLYRHYKGGVYEVYGLSQAEATGEWCVLYRNPQSGLPFHRPVSEWYEDMGGVRRFAPVQPQVRSFNWSTPRPIDWAPDLNALNEA